MLSVVALTFLAFPNISSSTSWWAKKIMSGKLLRNEDKQVEKEKKVSKRCSSLTKISSASNKFAVSFVVHHMEEKTEKKKS